MTGVALNTMHFDPTSARYRPSRRKWGRGGVALALTAFAFFAVAGCSTSQGNLAAVQAADAQAKAKAADAFNRDLAALGALSRPSDGDYRIGAEDLIEVTLYDIESEAGEPRVIVARVSNSGFITLPYIGQVKAEGMGLLELEESLRQNYLRFIHKPQITVFIREYRSFRVSVVGDVKNPGVLELRGRKNLLEAVAMAGGLSPDAGHLVALTRINNNVVQSVLIDLDKLAETGDSRLNPTLLPDDVINVPRAGVFYVEGIVKKPGAYPLLTKTTLTQAIATAGGVDESLSRASGTTLYRKLANGERQAFAIDVDDIASGHVPDMEVQSDDVIVVPISGTKYVFHEITGLLRVGVNASAF